MIQVEGISNFFKKAVSKKQKFIGRLLRRRFMLWIESVLPVNRGESTPCLVPMEQAKLPRWGLLPVCSSRLKVRFC